MKKFSDTVHPFDDEYTNIKKLIESEFYKSAANALSNRNKYEISIVSGPSIRWHLGQAKRFNCKHINIYEIDKEVFDIICSKVSKMKLTANVKVHLCSIEDGINPFIDCDLTAYSDLDKYIKKTFKFQSELPGIKSFIWTIGLRNKGFRDGISKIIISIFDVIGEKVKVSKSELKLKYFHRKTDNTLHYQIQMLVYFNLNNSRIKEVICYKYNAGGGPMLTCLINYI
jgi:hypothetical protein